jgi:hypothetical protein
MTIDIGKPMQVHGVLMQGPLSSHNNKHLCILKANVEVNVDGYCWINVSPAGPLNTNVNIEDLNQKGYMPFPYTMKARYVKIICAESSSGGPNGGARVGLVVTE